MDKYAMIVYWSEVDGNYLVEVPDLPGCMADGLTRAEAVINAEKIISEWIEANQDAGREIPTPSFKGIKS